MRKVLQLILALFVVSVASTASFAQTDSVDVTFKVNAALVTTDPAGLFLAGGGTFGIPGDNPMDDSDMDDTWEITVRLPKGFATDYTFTNGNCPNWGCKENIANLSCAVAPWNDRNFPGAWSDTTVLACFQDCSSDGTCPQPAAKIDVTFRVDMSQETGVNTMKIGGNFENWGKSIDVTDADNDNIWEATVNLDAGSAIEWKFIINDDWATSETFDSTHADCTLTSGDFINRYAVLGSADTTLPAFVYGSCALSTGTNVVFEKDAVFEINPTLVSDYSLVTFKNDFIYTDKTIEVVNAMGQVLSTQNVGNVQQHKLNVSELANGLYFVVIRAEGVAQTARIMVNH